MSVKSAKEAQKRASQIFRDRGAVVTERHRYWTTYKFPDNRTVSISKDERVAVTLAKIKDAQERYGYDTPDLFREYVSTGGKPRLDLDNLVASTHAKERLALMQQQSKITYQEVLHTLRLPERVLWSPVHESWCWIRGRIAVAVADSRGTQLITTVMWTSQELFEENPRPKERA
jgi:hypothetical protein